jgi:formylglycine-generating enzyme required for sulfatase activity
MLMNNMVDFTATDLVKIGAYGREFPADFLIARYPMTVSLYREIVEGKSGSQDGKLCRVTWWEAIRCCNFLSRLHGLPQAYNENTGLLIDEHGKPVESVLQVEGFRFYADKAKGYRLPTASEWEYAAKGLNNRHNSYLTILDKAFRIFGMDQITLEEYMLGQSDIDKLRENTIGVYGMLGNVHEWYSDNLTPDKLFKQCFWEDYIVNYNNDISFQIRTRTHDETKIFPFRIALSIGEAQTGEVVV